MRLIDADELLKEQFDMESEDTCITVVSEADIQNAKTVDAVAVVRCKDCKNAYINSFSAMSGIALCRLFTNKADGVRFEMSMDDFCSHGSKKE